MEIASRFSITIVQLDRSWPLSAAAGRFVGLRHARSELVLFVDGDYVLFDDWLPDAVRTIRSREDIAAVCGRDVEEQAGDSLLMKALKVATDTSFGEPEAVPIGLYRRAFILQIGGFHPYLRGGEDRDLAHRLRVAGYRIVRNDRDMGIHRWAERGPMDYITYFRSVLSWSMGTGRPFVHGAAWPPSVTRL